MTPADRVVIVFAIGLVTALYAFLWQAPAAGTIVRIRHDHHIVKELSLQEPRTVHIAGQLGDTVVEIKDQQVRFVSSPCPNKVCILHGWFNLQGEVMACVPNDVIVEILGKDMRFDAIAF
jgi:hypothetical protein